MYIHLTDEGRPFYVGKGYKDRCNKFTQRNRLWNDVAKREGVTPEIVSRYSDASLALAGEADWEDALRSLGFDLTNMVRCGQPDTTGYRHTPEALRKMSDSQTGRTASEETKRKMSLSHTGITHTEESIKLMSRRAKEKWLSPGYRDKVSTALSGKKRTQPQRDKISHQKIQQGGKYVKCLETEMVFRSTRQAAKWVQENTDKKSACHKGISHCARGNYKTSHGFTWVYVDD